MKLKKLNRQVVRSATTMLMLLDGSTTAAKVKLYLSDRGYRAGQSEVSCWLLRIAQREGWTITQTGTYRIYAFPPYLNVSVNTLPASQLTGLPLGFL